VGPTETYKLELDMELPAPSLLHVAGDVAPSAGGGMMDLVSKVPLDLLWLFLAAGTSLTNAYTPVFPENVTFP